MPTGLTEGGEFLYIDTFEEFFGEEEAQGRD